jgi:hypothetical protein
MTFQKHFHEIAKFDTKCKTYIFFNFEKKRKNIYLLKNDYKNEVLNLNNFRWRLNFLSLIDMNNSVINSVERLFNDVCV